MSRLELTNVVAYGASHPVVHIAHLEVGRGEVVGLVGPGGVGKTLLLRAVAGAVASSGTVLVDGSPIPGRSLDQRAAAGVALVPQHGPEIDDLTVDECLHLAARRHIGRWGALDADRPTWPLRTMVAMLPGLARVLDEEIGALGPWERLATALAIALRTSPRVLLVDEPLAGLGDGGLDRLAASMAQLADAGLGVLLTSRDAQRMRWTCDRVVALAPASSTSAPPTDAPVAAGGSW